jgi:stress response protein SCP2
MVDLQKHTVNLSKSQKVNLSKEFDGLNKVMVGLGWDPVGSEQKGGFFSRLFGSSGSTDDYDLDAWAACIDSNGKVAKTVYYEDKEYKVNGHNVIWHHGDNLTGEGDGDDEVISVSLNEIPSNVNVIAIAVTIFCARERRQSFANIKNTFVRVVDERDGFEMCRYESNDIDGKATTFVVGAFIRKGNEWEFKAVGQSSKYGSIGEELGKLNEYDFT